MNREILCVRKRTVARTYKNSRYYDILLYRLCFVKLQSIHKLTIFFNYFLFGMYINMLVYQNYYRFRI